MSGKVKARQLVSTSVVRDVTIGLEGWLELLETCKGAFVVL